MTAGKIVNATGKTVSKTRHEGAMKAWATKRAKQSSAANPASHSPSTHVTVAPAESRTDNGGIVVITTERVVSKARHEGALRAWAKRRAKLNGTATPNQPAKKVTSKNRHESAMRAWATRRANNALRKADPNSTVVNREIPTSVQPVTAQPAPVKSTSRSAAALKAWDTKRAKAKAKADARSARARKAWETRRANLSKSTAPIEQRA